MITRGREQTVCPEREPASVVMDAQRHADYVAPLGLGSVGDLLATLPRRCVRRAP
jgi:hypothetical protein